MNDSLLRDLTAANSLAAGDILYAVTTPATAPANRKISAQDLATSLSALAPPSSGAPFSDATALVKGSVDPTKQVRLEVDGLTTGQTRVITIPDANITLARTDAGQSFAGTQTFLGSIAAADSAGGVNLDGGSLVIRAGYSTGSGNSGHIALKTILANVNDVDTDVQETQTHDLLIVGDGSPATATLNGNLTILGQGFIGPNGEYDATGSLVLSYRDNHTTGNLGFPLNVSCLSTGTVGDTFGGRSTWLLQSVSGARYNAFDLVVSWVTAADASRKARAQLRVWDTSFSIARECIRMEASGTAPMLSFFGANAVVKPATTGETVGFTAGAGTAVKDDSTFTGNVGATAYRISDIVKALKNLGLLAQ